jgi:hypothetical protein
MDTLREADHEYLGFVYKQGSDLIMPINAHWLP